MRFTPVSIFPLAMLALAVAVRGAPREEGSRAAKPPSRVTSGAQPGSGSSGAAKPPAGVTAGAARILVDGTRDIAGLAWSPRGDCAAWYQANGGGVILYNSKTQEMETLLASGCYFDGAPSFAFTTDGQKLLTRYRDQIVVWDVSSRKVVQQFSAGAGQYLAFWPSPDGSRIVARANTPHGPRIDVIDTAANTHLSETQYTYKEFAGSFGAFSPTGKEVAVSTRDGQIQRWDAVTGRELPDITSDNRCDHMAGIVYSPDGTRLAIGYSNETFVSLWDVSQPQAPPRYVGKVELAKEVQGSEHRFYPSLVFSPDGAKLLVCTKGGVVLCDVAKRLVTHRFPGRYDQVGTFSPDGQWVVTAVDKNISFWNAQDGTLLTTLLGQAQLFAFSSDISQFFTAGEDMPVALWPLARRQRSVNVAQVTGRRDTPVQKKVGDLRSFSNGALLFSPDNRQLLAWGGCNYPMRTNPQFAEYGRFYKVYDVATAMELCTLETPNRESSLNMPPEFLNGVRFRPGVSEAVLLGPFKMRINGKNGIDGKTLLRWDTASGRMLPMVSLTIPAPLDAQKFSAQCTAYSPNGKWLAISGDDGETSALLLLELPSLNVKQSFPLSDRGTPLKTASALSFSADSRRIAAAFSSLDEVVVWDIPSQQATPLSANTDRGFTMAEEGKAILCMTKDRNLERWNLENGRRESLLAADIIKQPHNVSFPLLVLSPAGNAFATSDSTGIVLVRNPVDGKVLQTLEGSTAEISATAFSSDGRMLATGDASGAIRLWKLDLPTAASPQAPQGPTAGVATPPAQRNLRLEPWALLPVSAPQDNSWKIYRSDEGNRLHYRTWSDRQCSVQAWDLERKTSLFEATLQGLRDAVASPSGETLLGVKDKELTVWTPSTGDTRTLSIRGAKKGWPFRAVCVLSEETLVATLEPSRTGLVVVDLRTGEITKEIPTDEVHCIERSPGGKYLAVSMGTDNDRVIGDRQRKLRIYAADTLECLGTIKNCRIEREGQLVFTPSGTHMLICNDYSEKSDPAGIFETGTLRQRWQGRYEPRDVLGITDTRILKGWVLTEVETGLPRLAKSGNDTQQLSRQLSQQYKTDLPLDHPQPIRDTVVLWRASDKYLLLHDWMTNRTSEPVQVDLDSIRCVLLSATKDYVAVLGKREEGWHIQVWKTVAE